MDDGRTGTLRQHMKDRHPHAKMRRAQVDLEREHGRQHHRTSPDHFHAGVNLGPDARPSGWTTGEDVVLKVETAYPIDRRAAARGFTE